MKENRVREDSSSHMEPSIRQSTELNFILGSSRKLSSNRESSNIDSAIVAECLQEEDSNVEGLLSKEEEDAILREIERESQAEIEKIIQSEENQEEKLDLNDFVSQSDSEAIIGTQEMMNCLGSQDQKQSTR